jgi:hypothetical protein
MAYRLDQVKEDAIYDWAVASLGSSVKVIWDKPTAPRPELPYVTLNILGGPIQLGDRVARIYKELDTWTYQFKKRITLSINIFGYEDYLNKIEILLNSLYLESKIEILNVAGLASWGYDGPIDMSLFRDTEWEFRAQADIFLSYGDDVDDIPREIQKIELNGEIIE